MKGEGTLLGDFVVLLGWWFAVWVIGTVLLSVISFIFDVVVGVSL